MQIPYHHELILSAISFHSSLKARLYQTSQKRFSNIAYDQSRADDRDISGSMGLLIFLVSDDLPNKPIFTLSLIDFDLA